mgnify:CR=1 FL=1
MHDDDIRTTKAEVLRMAADEFRRAAAAGEDPESNLLAADLLEQRAVRIAAGEDDHSRVAAGEIDAEARLDGPQPDEGASAD